MPAVETRNARERRRLTQRRYRHKQRDRLVAAEEKVAQLTAQLEAAHLEQTTLAAELASRPEAGDEGDNDVKEEMGWLDEGSRRRLAQHDFVCTLPFCPMTLTFHELTRLPDEEVATLRVRYTVAFAECLLAMQGDETHPANARLVELTQEFSILWNSVCTKSPDDIRCMWVVINRMAGQDTQPDEWNSSVNYAQLARDANLTPRQIELTLDLRAVYLRNYGRIRRARMGLSGSVTQDGIHGRFDDASFHDSDVGNPGVLDQTRRLLQAEHCQFVEVVQLRLVNVRAFPTCVSALKLAEAVAAIAGQPAHTEVVTAAAIESAMTGATNITPLESVLPRDVGEGC